MAKNKTIYYKTDEEVELIRKACLLNSQALEIVARMIRPGITGLEIDKEAETLLRDHGATPAFKGFPGQNFDFPNTLCISVNETVVHGIPSDQPFKDGDIVSVDCGTFLNGFYGDCAYTFCLGEVAEPIMQLCRVTKTSLYRAIDQAVAGKRIGDIAYAVQQYTEREHKYGVVRELVGHGLGRNLHEAPEVPNFGRRGQGTKMQPGLVIAIEPMINLGKRHVRTLSDGWNVIAKDKKPSAHYEHTVLVRKGNAEILTTHEGVEQNIRNNPNVREVASLDEVVAEA